MDEKALERELRLNQIYLAIISRYKDYIEEKEHISVAELPSLVTPKNELVMKKADEIKSSFGIFSFKSNFYEASVDSFYYVKNNVEDVALPLEFWLAPADTIKYGIGDVLDKNILLCSILIALGNPASKVLVSVNDGNRKVLTYYELDGKAYALDFANGFKKFESKELLLKSLGMTDDTIAYEFNDSLYVDIS